MDKKLEIRRKIAHLLLGVILVVLIYYDLIGKDVLGVFTIITFLVFYISRKIKIPFLNYLLDKFERPHVRKVFPGKGPLFYLIGAELSLVFFTKDIAMASILILAIGDSIPKVAGMRFRRIKHPFSDTRFLEGVIAGIILSSLAIAVFIKGVMWYEVLIASTIAIFLEGVDMKIGLEKIDDNLIVPISAGVVISLIRWIF